MSQAQELVSADEFILRRIHKNHCNLGLPRVIHFAAFRPNKEDATGLSVYRQRYITPVQVAAAGRKPGEYFVVRLSVEALHHLSLTVVPEEAGDTPGHAIIPELSLKAYERDKEHLRDVLVELARLASQAIVHEPTS